MIDTLHGVSSAATVECDFSEPGHSTENSSAEPRRITKKPPTAEERKRRGAKDRARRQRHRMEVLNYYGNNDPKCACCKERRLEFLAIDHINGGGNAHRRELGIKGGSDRIISYLRKMNFPKGYRLLCHNCNHSLGAFGYCPHMIVILREELYDKIQHRAE